MYGLPTAIPPELKVNDMLYKMRYLTFLFQSFLVFLRDVRSRIDKKNKNGKIRITCVQAIGKSLPNPIPVHEDLVSKYLESTRN